MNDCARIVVLGASYGLLPGLRLALAGHAVTFVGRAAEIAAMGREDLQVILPDRSGGEPIRLSAPVAARAAPGRVALATPEDAPLEDTALVVLAMQEPHYRDAAVAALMARIAAAGTPCLSIMNLPPPPFLARIDTIPADVLEGVHASAAVWADFAPGRMTLASPDPQALRLDPERPGVLTVTLPSNFKVAPFARAEDQALLERLARDVARFKQERAELAPVRPPVQLRASGSLHVPLAKWPMLIAGNCRCLVEGGTRSIAEAVHADLAETGRLYAVVAALVRDLGASETDVVPFAAYADAARALERPSSVARALASGARDVERVDLLVLRLLRARGLETAPVEPIVARIERLLAANRAA